MGLQTRKDGAFKYVRLKEGKFFLSTDKDFEQPYDELDGVLVDIGTKVDTFQSNVIEKIYLNMESEGEIFNVSFPIDSSYATSFMSFIKNVDLTQPFTLVPLIKMETKDGDEHKKLSMLIRQNGSFMKSYFTKETPNGLPKMKKVKLNGKEVWDKTDMIDFYRELIKTDLKPKVKPVDTVTSTVSTHPAAAKTVTEPVAEEVVDDDDLPF